ncbi:MAG: hypothetical protein SOV75_05665 [Candidatus Limiplasma sp.]|nr:hypothetical protein [Candidatus Limiplasma sp.]
MKKRMYILVAALLMMILTDLRTCSLAAADYVSIKELRDTLPQRWTGEYIVENGAYKQLEKGDTVSVDVPIVVPEVDAVPVVRITWEPPAEGLDGSLEVVRDDWTAKGINRNFPMDELAFPVLEDHMTFTPELPWEEAPAIAMAEFQKWMPFMKDKELTPYFHRSYGDSDGNGFQGIYFYTTYYGIPHFIGNYPFRHELKSEKSEVEGRAIAPHSMVAMRIKRPGEFCTNIYTSKEVGVDIDDIPLLSFDRIMEVLEQWVTDGYVYSLNEISFGYMCFIDPEKKGEEFVLLPVWAAKGRTREDLSLPFDLKTDQAVKDRGGYFSSDIVINAQTGQPYDLLNDKRPDRLHVPHIITWDEVK